MPGKENNASYSDLNEDARSQFNAGLHKHNTCRLTIDQGKKNNTSLYVYAIGLIYKMS